MSTKRILSIDGGGVKGVFPAALLAELEKKLNEKLLYKNFELVVGTSTGSIISAAIAFGIPVSKVLSLYNNHATKIFEKTGLGILNEKYDSTSLKSCLEEVFADKKIGEAKTRLVIPSFNIENGQVHIFKTPHNVRFHMDSEKRVVDAILASTAAPVFFKPHLFEGQTPLVDGGVFANNPISIAINEAQFVLRWPIEELRLLSIGCTQTPFKMDHQNKKGFGLNLWGKDKALLEILFQGQSEMSTNHARLALENQHFLRINPDVPNNRYKLDHVENINYLSGLGKTEARNHLSKIIELLETQHKKREPTQPEL